MNKKQLAEFREDVVRALAERQALGDFDTNAKHMRLLLQSILNLVNHAIEKYPKPVKK